MFFKPPANWVLTEKTQVEKTCSGLDTSKKHLRQIGVSLDYLAGLTDNQVDAATLGKILEIQALPEADRRHIMTTVDALLRDAKARKAYA